MSAPPAAFYFDLASPLAYFAAERVLQVLPVAAEWRPVLALQLTAQEAEIVRAELDRRARELQLQPLRLPDPFPFDSALAMRVATYAASIGRAVPFAQAAFRQAFAGGRSLAEAENVLIAAAACEMHPAAVLRAAELRSSHERLAEATRAAARDGVREVPTVAIGEELFAGERAVEHAARRAHELLAGAGEPAGSAGAG